MSQVEIIKIEEMPASPDMKYLSELPDEVIAKIRRFKRGEDAYRAYLGELLRRRMIASFLACQSTEIEFYYNEFGKPFVKSPKNCYFNISHAGAYVVGMIDCKPVGIDIEKIEYAEECLPIEYMHHEERKKLESFTDFHDKLHYFYFLWTMKEAYSKAIGKGLSKELSSFRVDRNAKGEIVIQDEELPSCPFTVFDSIKIGDEYILSTAGCTNVTYHCANDVAFLAQN